MNNQELLNVEGDLYCQKCEVTFKVYGDNEENINLCPYCGTYRENLFTSKELSERDEELAKAEHLLNETMERIDSLLNPTCYSLR